MGPALENLADEAEALHANLEGLNALAASLETFNESFASYLYVQKINVFCVEWYQVRYLERLSFKAEHQAIQGTNTSVARAG